MRGLNRAAAWWLPALAYAFVIPYDGSTNPFGTVEHAASRNNDPDLDYTSNEAAIPTRVQPQVAAFHSTTLVVEATQSVVPATTLTAAFPSLFPTWTSQFMPVDSDVASSTVHSDNARPTGLAHEAVFRVNEDEDASSIDSTTVESDLQDPVVASFRPNNELEIWESNSKTKPLKSAGLLSYQRWFGAKCTHETHGLSGGSEVLHGHHAITTNCILRTKVNKIIRFVNPWIKSSLRRIPGQKIMAPAERVAMTKESIGESLNDGLSQESFVSDHYGDSAASGLPQETIVSDSVGESVIDELPQESQANDPSKDSATAKLPQEAIISDPLTDPAIDGLPKESHLTFQPSPSRTQSDISTPTYSAGRTIFNAPTHQRNEQALRAFLITSIIILIVSICGALFAFFRANPRRRADRAACREECNNKRLYRQAAYRHRLREWYHRARGLAKLSQPPNHVGGISNHDSWTEKQITSLSHTDLMNANVRTEILALRYAHQIVDGIVRAEAGFTSEDETAPKERIRRIRRIQRRSRRVSEAGSESSAPPPYEEPTERDMVDGFQYTVMSYAIPLLSARADSTPDSSVIDTSPRTSVYIRDSDSEKD